MKITNIKPILLSAPYGAPNDTELKRFYPLGKRSAAFVIVETDEGVTGLGETYAGVFVPELVAQLVNYLGERLTGSDPFEIAELHRMMTRATSYWGHGGFAKNVISAVEIALWDLKGKALKLPVYELLGGARVEDIELYASGGLAKTLDDLEEELRGYMDARFKAVKIRDRNFEVTPVARSRAAIGPDVRLIVDTNQSFTSRPARFAEALRYARRIAEHDVWFLEEPLAVDDLNGYRRLVVQSPMPISGGETFNSAATFRQWIDARAFDIAQPDAAVMGGIGECVETLRAAEAAGIEGVCHAFAAAPCQAANVHAAFAAGSRVFEWAMPHNPLRTELLIEPWKIKDGKLRRPELPGLGIALTEEVMKKYAYIPGAANPGNFK
jgi:L-alanine-DL-glutamate epimerase-like enolase superfamily enzyme